MTKKSIKSVLNSSDWLLKLKAVRNESYLINELQTIKILECDGFTTIKALMERSDFSFSPLYISLGLKSFNSSVRRLFYGNSNVNLTPTQYDIGLNDSDKKVVIACSKRHDLSLTDLQLYNGLCDPELCPYFLKRAEIYTFKPTDEQIKNLLALPFAGHLLIIFRDSNYISNEENLEIGQKHTDANICDLFNSTMLSRYERHKINAALGHIINNNVHDNNHLTQAL